MEKLKFREAVRKRPGMWFGETQDGSAANHVVFELVANGIDQFLSGSATSIEVRVDQRSINVEDDGPGLPFDRSSKECPDRSEAEEFLENPHFSPSATGHAPHVHVRSLGVGLAAVNAIADSFEVWSDNGDEYWHRSYASGLPAGEAKSGPSSGKSGTGFRLELNPAWAPSDLEMLRSTLRDQVFLYPDLHLSLNGESFHGPRGLLDLGLAEFRGLYPNENAGRSVWHQDVFDQFRLHIALIGEDAGRSLTRSWVNGVETIEGGSHIQGLNRALGRRRWRPAVKLLHIIMEEPEYAGPTKGKLDAPHIVGLVERAMNSLL